MSTRPRRTTSLSSILSLSGYTLKMEVATFSHLQQQVEVD